MLLRRRKQDVLPDLPAKTEIVLPLELAGAQRSLYETLRLAQHERVQQAVQERGLAQAGIIVLVALFLINPSFFLDVAGDPAFVPGFGALIILYLIGFFMIRRMIDLKV